MLHPCERTLSNGLRVVVIRLPHLHAVAEALFVRSGPRYETEDDNGISHFVEHLLFHGTIQNPSSFDFNVKIDALGGEINGLTQRDATTIHLTVPPRAARAALELLGEITTQSILGGIDVERSIVLEEMLDTLDSDGFELDADTLARRTMWANHPMSFPIAGEPEVIERLSYAECRAHYERTFVAANSVLLVAGPVDVDEIVATAETAFARMPRGARMPEPVAPRPVRNLPIQVQPTDESQVSVLLSFPAPHENDPDFPALFLLKRVLDDGFASRLRHAICEKAGLAYSLGAAIDAYGDVGAFDIELECAPRKVVAAVREIWAVLDDLVAGVISEEELARAKTRHTADLEFALDDPNEICGWYGAMALMNTPLDHDCRLAEVLATTPDAVLTLAKRMFLRDAALLTLVGTVEESDTRELEPILGRDPESTVWLGSEEDDDERDDDEAPAESKRAPSFCAYQPASVC